MGNQRPSEKMVDPDGEISKGVSQTLRNWAKTLETTVCLDQADFKDFDE